MKKLTPVLMGIFSLFFMLTEKAFSELNYGDHKSSTLTTKAWDAFGAGKYDEALAYIKKCLELYEQKAKEMQASLSSYPPNEPKQATAKYWALNDVGTCVFIKGELLAKKGDSAGAIAAYKKLVNEFKYAQCWDPKGWFWKPAQAAKKKIVELEFDQEKP